MRESVVAEMRAHIAQIDEAKRTKKIPNAALVLEAKDQDEHHILKPQRRNRQGNDEQEMMHEPCSPRTRKAESRTLMSYSSITSGTDEPLINGVAEKQSSAPTADSRLLAVVKHNAYRSVVCSLLIFSAFLEGLQTDFAARNLGEEPPQWFWMSDIFFCVLFVLDLSLQIFAQGSRSFFCNEGAGWNWFDAGTVTIQVIDSVGTTMSFAGDSQLAKNSKSLRLFRLVRVLRVARVFKALTSLRKLIVSVCQSIKCLIWPVLLIFVMTYIYGLFFTQVVTEHRQELSEEELEDQEELAEFFGGVGKSMLVLFQTISDGIHWGEVMKPLTEFVSPWLVGAFIVYIGFVLFAMMNVITAFFVESAMDAAALEDKDQIVKNLVAAFPMDNDGHSRSITEAEFNAMLDSEYMREYLLALDLTPEDARELKLFRVLDHDNSGTIEPAEAIETCHRLVGNAKALDLATLASSVRSEMMLATKHRGRMEALLQEVVGH